MFLVETPLEMQELGMKIGKELIAGDVVALNGPLGAGKTELTKGIGAALGISERMTAASCAHSSWIRPIK